MTKAFDPYEELCVARDAMPEEITRAFREQVKQAHPDAGGDIYRFKRVNSAALILRDPIKRARYDRRE